MTDNEIIKELEKWLELFPNSMIKNALALINHQKEELENLKEEIKKVKNRYRFSTRTRSIIFCNGS